MLVATSFGRLRDLPNPQFVELVETNPEVTAAVALAPGPSTGSGTSPAAPKFVEPVETNPEATAAVAPAPGPSTSSGTFPAAPLKFVELAVC